MLTDAQRWYPQKIPLEQRVAIQSYDPEIETIVGQLNNEIHSVAPNLAIRHMGAAALKISGQNDIDLYVFCPQGQFGEYLPKLMKQLKRKALTESSLGHRGERPVELLRFRSGSTGCLELG